MRIVRGAGLVVVLGAVVLGTTTAFGSAPISGTIQVLAIPASANGANGKILVAGALGDFGKYVTINKAGKPDQSGNFVRVTLQKGAFEIDSTALNQRAADSEPIFNQNTCSGYETITGPNTLLKGSGAYAGITGTINVTETIEYDLSRYKSGAKQGQCNTADTTKPLAFSGYVVGTGTVVY
jgi:hypothetical protein